MSERLQPFAALVSRCIPAIHNRIETAEKAAETARVEIETLKTQLAVSQEELATEQAAHATLQTAHDELTAKNTALAQEIQEASELLVHEFGDWCEQQDLYLPDEPMTQKIPKPPPHSERTKRQRKSAKKRA